MAKINTVLPANARFPRTQLFFRILAFLGSFTAIVAALDARVKVHKTWGMVYVAVCHSLLSFSGPSTFISNLRVDVQYPDLQTGIMDNLP